MSVKSLLLAKVFTLVIGLVSLPALAGEPNYSINGFLYNTSFSQTSFHEPRTVLAVNFDADYGPLAFRAQAGTYDETVRRAVVEYSTNIGEVSDITYQAGRFARVDSFFNGIVDTPASSQMAMLPLAGYSYRMFNGAFVLMDGQQIVTTTRHDDIRYSFRAATGHMVIPSQKDIQLEAIHKTDSQLDMVNRKQSYDLGFHIETQNWHWYVARNYYTLNLETDAKDRLHKYIVSKYAEFDYTLDRAGVRYDNKKWFISTEQGNGRTFALSSKNVDTGKLIAEDMNVVTGIYYNNTVFYTGYSEGRNRTAGTKNTDSFIGITQNYKRTTISLDYHNGNGIGWSKYVNGSPNWSSFVASITYRF